MSSRERFNAVMVICIVIMFVIGITTIKLQSRMLMGVFFAWTFVWAFLLLRVRRSNCATPLSYQRRILGIPIHGVSHTRIA